MTTVTVKTLEDLNAGLRPTRIKFYQNGFLVKKWTIRNNLGFIAFADDFKKNNLPYIPVGGKNAIQAIINGGGFCGIENMIILSEKCFSEM